MLDYSIEDLKQEIPYKWKVNNFNKAKDKANIVAYIDARDAMDLLDKVVGSENWMDEYREVDGQLICRLSIKDPSTEEWVYKEDCGTESMTEKEKGQISDAFKRAAVKWGVGRFLYRKDMFWLKAANRNVVDDSGKRIWDLSEHMINSKKDSTHSRAVFFMSLNKLSRQIKNKGALGSLFMKYFSKRTMLNPSDDTYGDFTSKVLKELKVEMQDLLQKENKA